MTPARKRHLLNFDPMSKTPLKRKTSFWLKTETLKGLKQESANTGEKMGELADLAIANLLRSRQTPAVHPAKKGGKK